MVTSSRMRTALLAAVLATASGASSAALVGVTPAEPVIDFGAGGIIDYVATTGLVTVSGVPATLFQTDPLIVGPILGTGDEDEALLSVQFKVDASGALVPGGVAGADLVIKGSVDTNFDSVPDYTGTLLEAEVIQFGHQDNVDGSGIDQFDLRLNAVGGALATLYAGRDLAVTITSEPSTEYATPFAGSFTSDFTGPAKGVVGATAPLVAESCKIKVQAQCSVEGGPFKDKCRIKQTRSWHHWDFQGRTHRGVAHRRYAYGAHGDPTPSWSSRYPGTDVTFRYVLRNKGATAVSGITVDDSFDSAVPGVPATLAPGASATMTRVVTLREALENTVVATASAGTASCGAVDTVVIRDKLRERRRHDYDDYKDKGTGDNDAKR